MSAALKLTNSTITNSQTADLKKFFQEYWSNILAYHSGKKKLDDLDWFDFIRIVSIMNIRTAGTKIEARILKRNNWTKIRGHAEHGDGKTSDGKIIEIKSSTISPMPGSGITFRGIRIWHNVDEHHFILTDLKDYLKDPVTYTFRLTKNQLIEERDKHGTLRPYGMKKADRIANENIELGTSNLTPTDLYRWIETYSSQIKL